MDYSHQEAGTSHEQLRREIEMQISQFLEQGGTIDCLTSPEYQAARSVRASGTILTDH